MKTEFLLAQTTSQGCVQIVESSMPLAVTRPFVEEFITKEDIDKVNTVYGRFWRDKHWQMGQSESTGG